MSEIDTPVVLDALREANRALDVVAQCVKRLGGSPDELIEDIRSELYALAHDKSEDRATQEFETVLDQYSDVSNSSNADEVPKIQMCFKSLRFHQLHGSELTTVIAAQNRLRDALHIASIGFSSDTIECTQLIKLMQFCLTFMPSNSEAAQLLGKRILDLKAQIEMIEKQKEEQREFAEKYIGGVLVH